MTARRLQRSGRVETVADGTLGVAFGQFSDAADLRGGACCGRCPTGPMMARLGGAALHRLAGPSVRAGDRLELSVASRGLLCAALLAFGVPLAGLVGGAWAGSVAGGDAASLLSGIGGFMAGLLAMLRSGDRMLAVLEPRARILVGNLHRAEDGGV